APPCTTIAPPTVSGPIATRPAGGFAMWNVPSPVMTVRCASWIPPASRMIPSRPATHAQSRLQRSQTDVGARPDSFQTLVNLASLLALLLGQQAAFQTVQ